MKSNGLTSIRWPIGVAVLVAAMACGSWPAVVSAQPPEAATIVYQRRMLEEQLRPIITPEFRVPPVQQRLLYDYGAALTYTALWYEDHGPTTSLAFPFFVDFQASRAVHDWDFRPWASVSVDGVHYGFLRGQLDFLQYYSGDSYYRNSDWRGPFVDIGFYRMDVDEAFRRYLDCPVQSWSVDVTLGRQFLYIGRGISLLQVLDAGSVDWSWGDWAGLVFAGTWIRHYDNIDRSVPGYSNSDREFFGAQVEYQRFDHHLLYAYVVSQRDRSSEAPPDPNQEYDYDSDYWGLGAQGEALLTIGERTYGVKNLEYFAEFILQRGYSYGHGATLFQDQIHAWALDVGLIYYAPVPSQARFMVEYARASGDSDRFMPQNTWRGNQAGTTDHGFLPFGYVYTGYSFAPLFANLEFVRLSAACMPLRQRCGWQLRDLEVGSSLYFYWRPEEMAGVSDLRADIPGDNYLGQELDLWLNWRMSSDLYLLINYGIFWPHSDSFSVDNSRQFLSASLTLLL